MSPLLEWVIIVGTTAVLSFGLLWFLGLLLEEHAKEVQAEEMAEEYRLAYGDRR